MAMRPEEKSLREELIGAQEHATFQKNYLVEAGAGAGKTYTMVRRIANHLLSGGCEPENLVAITFTKKATEEMRSRLDRRMEELLAHARRGERDESGVRLTDSEQAQRIERLEHLIRNAGRMQISTIHSFCQTMLSTMPFASPLGPDASFGEDEGDHARAFFARYLKNNPDAFKRVQSKFGLSDAVLSSFFAARCTNKGAHIVARPLGDPEVAAWEATCLNESKKLHRRLRADLGSAVLCHGDMEHIDAELADVLRMDEPAFAKDNDAIFTLIRLINQNATAFPLRAFDKTAQVIRAVSQLPTEEWDQNAVCFCSAHPLSGAIASLDRRWKSTAKTAKDTEQPAVGLLRTTSKLLLYAWLIDEVTPVLQAYQAEKRTMLQAFSDDQLMLARDMLRTSAEARQYFHRRYRAVYVDEFQDTDPLQTELLFYLTTEEASFDPNDWRNCRPIPGSLFLVGDPKQSIYGFRGADISIYREVYTLFTEHTIGECVTLQCSFRASEAVCRYNNAVFSSLFKNSTSASQASFSEMDVNAPGDPDAGIYFYHCETAGTPLEDTARSAADAKMLCAFIQGMVGSNTAGKPYRYRDFMLITPTTATVPYYMNALAEAGIPANITAKHTYGDFPPLQRLSLYLEWLLGRNTDLTLLRLLKDGYRVELRTINALMQRGGMRSISMALTLSEQKDPICLALAAALRQERAAETEAEKCEKLDALLSLCGALEELSAVQRMARTAPAMSTIEYILQSCRGIWDEGTALVHRRQCGWLLQFLALLRGCEQHSFPALAAFAIDSMSAEVSQELALNAADDCVRVMNLHQAKGLEARVVILTYSTKGLAAPGSLLVRSGGETKEYTTLSYQKFAGAGYSTVAYPPEWEGSPVKKGQKASFSAKTKAKEQHEAERVRLLYVAATRAAELLIVNTDGGDRSFWAMMTDSGIARLANGGSLLPPAQRRCPAAFDCLDPAKVSPPSTPAAAPAGKMTAVSGFELEQRIAERAERLAQSAYFAITPSGLDHGTHAPTRVDRAADEEDHADSAPVPQEPPAETEPVPRGAYWGTIVHSVMEQAVRHADSSRSALMQYAREAASSVLTDGALSAREWDMVLGGREIDDHCSRIAYVAEKAAEAAAFFSDPASPLRVLTDGADCYPELPFTLCESNSDSALFRHLEHHLSNTELRGKRLELQGVIDLAVWKDGAWTVVDYKTDCIRSGESCDAFRERLKGEYTAQILSYAQVLERLRGKVRCAVLCSIALGGELIELPLSDAPAAEPSASLPDTAHAAECSPGGPRTTPLTELLDGRRFLPALQTAQGAYSFSLLRGGRPVPLLCEDGTRSDTFQKCASFVRAIERELCVRDPSTAGSIDYSNAGSVALLRRMLRVMRRTLPREEWNALSLRWKTK